LFSRGHIYKILSNPIYVGRISHKGQVYEGQHPPTMTGDLWKALATLSALRGLSELANRPMRCSLARYYVSQAARQGDKSKAASILRLPAADVEKLVAEAVGKLSSSDASPADIRSLIDRVLISRATIQIHLREVAD
jgi:site-specific DNA recombinase